MMPKAQTVGPSETVTDAATQDALEMHAVSGTESDPALQNGPAGTPARPVDEIVLHEEQPFHIVAHVPAQEIPYGTLCLRLKPRAIGGYRPLLTKGAADHGDPQRLCLAMREDRIVLALAIPYTQTVCEWQLEAPALRTGSWTHLALSFDHRGTSFFVDGAAVPDEAWTRLRGPHAAPSAVTDFSLENNARPIVLGYPRQLPPEAPASDDAPVLQDRYFGPVEFALWGGYTPQSTLTPKQVFWLATKGMDGPSSPRPEAVAGSSAGHGHADALPARPGSDDVRNATREREPAIA